MFRHAFQDPRIYLDVLRYNPDLARRLRSHILSQACVAGGKDLLREFGALDVRNVGLLTFSEMAHALMKHVPRLFEHTTRRGEEVRAEQMVQKTALIQSALQRSLLRTCS